eukprot:tig00021346_g20372.t1
MDLSTFEGLGVDAALLEGLRSRGIEEPVEVQQAAVPAVLDGEDVIIQSHTGTGKTLAYVLPLLSSLLASGPPAPGKKGATGPEVLIVAPTRELSMQICLEIEGVSAGLVAVQQLIGGANPERQVEKLKKRRPRVVAGTPGRLRELIDTGKLKCGNLRAVVLDEVDHLMSDAFARDLGHILRTANPARRQTIFVSATVPSPVLDLAADHMKDPLHIQVDASKLVTPRLEHAYIVAPPRKKAETLRRLFVAAQPSCALTFINDPRRINELAEYLSSNGTVEVAVLHGEADKEARGNVLNAVRRGKVSHVVCTEMAARGLDLPGVSHVFNLDLPTDHLHYLHRAGRTGRLNQGREGKGTVVTVVTPEEEFVVGKIERALGVTFRRVEVYAGKLFDALPG